MVNCVDQDEYPGHPCTESRPVWWKGGEAGRRKIPWEQAAERPFGPVGAPGGARYRTT